ncbi:MAG: hypothetical protein COZ04_02915 [Candidatus Aenigmarchaeota archaeon CG_4_10_14_3_um_filter_37_21]|nr:MAG: hypothetical protein COZ52_02940 [Candidatus Aenigmarchaeota archaeon CG_4_8_14_3_um_filter_37_24]PIY35616.1 MAG: hypothetical protein COZ04_02915 [Candidatus Aenigmarchaeota archaeon CG_4_10_14_3_um_filter_37_21]
MFQILKKSLYGAAILLSISNPIQAIAANKPVSSFPALPAGQQTPLVDGDYCSEGQVGVRKECYTYDGRTHGTCECMYICDGPVVGGGALPGGTLLPIYEWKMIIADRAQRKAKTTYSFVTGAHWGTHGGGIGEVCEGTHDKYVNGVYAGYETVTLPDWKCLFKRRQ